MSSELAEQILETWRIHHRLMLFLIENLGEEALKASLSKRGGRDIARQLAHVNTVRIGYMEAYAKKHSLPLIQFKGDESPGKAALSEAFTKSGEAMTRFIEHSLADGGKVSGFKRGLVPFLGYLISHEAHHRGHLMLTMKEAGFKIPDNVKWGIWDWNKI
jgi:uncharacterized damage-inducible protein DinB